MVESCTTCVYGGRPTYDYPCNECVKTVYLDDVVMSMYEREKPPVTNADRIRAMSDEELAKFFHDHDMFDCSMCSEYESWMELSDTMCDEKCAEHCLKWLQQPWEGK